MTKLAQEYNVSLDAGCCLYSSLQVGFWPQAFNGPRLGVAEILYATIILYGGKVVVHHSLQ